MSPEVEAAIIAGGVGVLTLIGTLVAQYLGRRATSGDTQKALEEQRKQLGRTLAEQRTRTWNERFATAADKLGSNKPSAVRLAGVYAMAGLADDWEENRQTCVNVLCAYLRLPYETDLGDGAHSREQLDFRASREVRHTVIRVITDHLRDGAAKSWQGLNFDFTSVVFDGGDFSCAVFSSGNVSFSNATFSGGTVNFVGTKFSGAEVSFGSATFSDGKVSFHDAEFSGGTVSFIGAMFSGGTVNVTDATFSGCQVNFSNATFSADTVDFGGSKICRGTVSFIGATFSGAEVRFLGATFSGGQVNFTNATFSGGQVRFSLATFSGGRVSFGSATFSGGTVSFVGATFSGADVSFANATFPGGQVDFSRPGGWLHPPTFDWPRTPPAGVKLPIPANPG